MDGTMPAAPAPIAPPPAALPPRAPRKRWLRVLLVAVVVIVVIAMAGYAVLAYTPWGAQIRTAWGIWTLPAELRGALFIGAAKDGSAEAYRIDHGAFVPVTIPGSMSSISLASGHQAVIAWHAAYHELYLDGASFLESTSTLAHVALSPDGAWIAASESKAPADAPNPAVPEPLTGPSAQGWQVVLFSTKRDRPKSVIAPGSSPAFTNDMLLWIDPRGIVGMKLSDGTRKVLVDATSTTVISPIEVSADGSALAVRDLSAHRISIYRLSDGSTAFTASVADTGSPFFALGNQAVYIARVNKSGETDIWKEPFRGGAERVLTIPASLHILRVVLPMP